MEAGEYDGVFLKACRDTVELGRTRFPVRVPTKVFSRAYPHLLH